MLAFQVCSFTPSKYSNFEYFFPHKNKRQKNSCLCECQPATKCIMVHEFRHVCMLYHHKNMSNLAIYVHLMWKVKLNTHTRALKKMYTVYGCHLMSELRRKSDPYQLGNQLFHKVDLEFRGKMRVTG